MGNGLGRSLTAGVDRTRESSEILEDSELGFVSCRWRERPSCFFSVRFHRGVVFAREEVSAPRVFVSIRAESQGFGADDRGKPHCMAEPRALSSHHR